MILFTTNSFKKSVKQLQKKHNKRALDDLWRAIEKVCNQEVGKSMDNHKLSGRHANGFNDIHLAGGDLILLYRYDVDSDTLVVSAKLKDIVNHDQLNRPQTFAEPQWRETTLGDLEKDIKGSTQRYINKTKHLKQYEPLDDNEIESWFFDFYNKDIAPIVPIDDIAVTDIVDLTKRVRIEAEGIQYREFYSESGLNRKARKIEDMCFSRDIDSRVIVLPSAEGADEFRIQILIDVPLEEVD